MKWIKRWLRRPSRAELLAQVEELEARCSRLELEAETNTRLIDAFHASNERYRAELSARERFELHMFEARTTRQRRKAGDLKSELAQLKRRLGIDS